MFLSSIATAAVLAGGLHSPAAPLVAPARAQTTPATAEGVEILRRILADAIDKAFEHDDPDAPDVRFGRSDAPEIRGLVTTLWTAGQTVSHSRAFHLPGRGVLFSLDVSLPTVRREASASDGTPPTAHDDEWDRIRRQVRGGDQGGLFVHRAERIELEIDPTAVDRLTETVVATLGRHASRVEGLGPQDVLTVAIHMAGGRESAWTHWKVMSDTEMDEDESRSFVLTLGADVPEQRLVLEVPLADVQGAGQDGRGRLADRVRVNRY